MITYLSLADVGAWFGVSRGTVSKWRTRYPDAPKPDALVGGTPGWLPEREADWRKWYQERWTT